MCNALLAKDSPPERSVRQRFIDAFVEVLKDWHTDLLQVLRDGDLPLAVDEATRRAVAQTLDEHRESFRAEFETLWTDSARAGRSVAARRHDLDIDDEISERLARELRSLAVSASDEVETRMTDDITAALRDAWEDDIGIPEMERILKEEVFPDMRGYEAERAARTEGTAGANRGRVASFRDAGAPGKVWLAEDDHRTRDAHDDADNQTVAIGESFEVDGEEAAYPGDPRLSASNRINCRCGIGPAWEL